MKYLILLISVVFAVSCSSNYTDRRDENSKAAHYEQREEERENKVDLVDKNKIPAAEEKRENEEDI